MKKTVYGIAVLLIVIWFLGNYVYELGAFIHVFLITAIVTTVLTALKPETTL